MGIYTVIARFSYEPDVANAADDLPLQVGDLVEVTEEVDDDWLFGSKDNGTKSGYFPRNFVERSEAVKEEPVSALEPIEPSKLQENETEVLADVERKDEAPALKSEHLPDTSIGVDATEFKSKIKTFAHDATAPPMPDVKPSNDTYLVKKPFAGVTHSSSYVPPSLGTKKAHATINTEQTRKPDVVSGDVNEEEVEAPRLTLKERMALLQKQQAEEQQAIEAALKRKEERKKAKRPQSVASDSRQSQIDMHHQLENPEEFGDGQTADENDEIKEDVEFQHGNEAADDEDDETNEDEEDDDADEEEDEEDEEDEDEDEEDEEELRKRKLAERMAKLSGGMGMMGMMGMPMPGMFTSSNTKPSKKKTVKKEDSQETSQLPKAVPVLPFATHLPPQLAKAQEKQKFESEDENEASEEIQIDNDEVKGDEVKLDSNQLEESNVGEGAKDTAIEEVSDESYFDTKEKEDKGAVNESDDEGEDNLDKGFTPDMEEKPAGTNLEVNEQPSIPVIPPIPSETSSKTANKGASETQPVVLVSDNNPPPIPSSSPPAPSPGLHPYKKLAPQTMAPPPVPVAHIPITTTVNEPSPSSKSTSPHLPPIPHMPMTAPPPPVPSQTNPSSVQVPVPTHSKRHSTIGHPAPPPPPPSEPPVPAPAPVSNEASPVKISVAVSPAVTRATTNVSADYAPVTANNSWWVTSTLPLEISLDDVYFEVETTPISRRGASNVIYVIYYILDIHLTTRTLELAYDEASPNELIFFKETKTKHKPEKALLQSQYIKYGSQIYNAAVGLLNKPTAGFLSDIFGQSTEVIPPIGGKTFGAMTYKNNDNEDIKAYDEIRKGDILVLVNATFESHKGPLRKSKSFSYGIDSPHVAVVSGWDKANGKITVIEENGGTVVEGSYKLGRLVSGKLRVFRVVGRDYIGW